MAAWICSVGVEEAERVIIKQTISENLTKSFDISLSSLSFSFLSRFCLVLLHLFQPFSQHYKQLAVHG